MLAYTLKLKLKVYFTNIKAEKIDNFIFKILEMVLTNFKIKIEFQKLWFFWEILLLANSNIEIVLEILFLILSKAKNQFINKNYIERFYILAKTLLITK